MLNAICPDVFLGLWCRGRMREDLRVLGSAGSITCCRGVMLPCAAKLYFNANTKVNGDFSVIFHIHIKTQHIIRISQGSHTRLHKVYHSIAQGCFCSCKVRVQKSWRRSKVSLASRTFSHTQNECFFRKLSSFMATNCSRSDVGHEEGRGSNDRPSSVFAVNARERRTPRQMRPFLLFRLAVCSASCAHAHPNQARGAPPGRSIPQDEESQPLTKPVKNNIGFHVRSGRSTESCLPRLPRRRAAEVRLIRLTQRGC